MQTLSPSLFPQTISYLNSCSKIFTASPLFKKYLSYYLSKYSKFSPDPCLYNPLYISAIQFGHIVANSMQSHLYDVAQKVPLAYNECSLFFYILT